MIKVLFLSKANRPDYMCDMVYHGLKSNENILIEEIHTPHYMYSYYMGKSNLYGKGFTLYGHLTKYPTNLSVEGMKSRVKRKYYDYIFYGSIHRYNNHFDFITEFYPKEKIFAIDGEDGDQINYQFVNKSLYYKRELSSSNENIRPINFCIPQDLIVPKIPTKTKRVAYIIPGDLNTYIFDSQDHYYQDYQSSVFGTTCKKAGWDCLRHYEILLNGCIPYFKDLEKCPALTMNLLPKQILLETNSLFAQQQDFDFTPYIKELINYTENHLTTKKLAEYLLPSF
jgi:hypothetical protein